MTPRLVALACALLVGGCGGAASRADPKLPGEGRPAVRLATKNFTEQFILGELYAQALRAKGYRVDVKQDVGSSELVNQALLAHTIDMYAEYTGVIVGELAGMPTERSAAATYAAARAYERRHGFTLLERSPGADVLASAVLPATARRYHLRSNADLRRLGAFRYGGPPENRTRFQGAVGLRRVYGLTRMTYVDLPISQRYTALDRHRVQVTSVFTTEGQLAERGRYVVLSDPKGIFGFQNIAPVVDSRVLRREGPVFARTLNAVTRLLTNAALQQMNGAVDLRHQQPADVARRFLRAHGLLA